MSRQENNLRGQAAIRFAKEMGFSVDKIKPILKNLVKLYDNNWEFIEEDGYKALLDALLDPDEEPVQKKQKTDQVSFGSSGHRTNQGSINGSASIDNISPRSVSFAVPAPNCTPMEDSPESLTFTETELTLAPPGSSRPDAKRNLSVNGTKRSTSAKAQAVGWPPVKAAWRSSVQAPPPEKYVKVAVDGAALLRKVDLEAYKSYDELVTGLEKMLCINIQNCEGEIKNSVHGLIGTEFVLTYEDKDGDWMMAGDVPWKMFVEVCDRIRLMKSSDAVDLAPATPQRSSNVG